VAGTLGIGGERFIQRTPAGGVVVVLHPDHREGAQPETRRANQLLEIAAVGRAPRDQDMPGHGLATAPHSTRAWWHRAGGGDLVAGGGADPVDRGPGHLLVDVTQGGAHLDGAVVLDGGEAAQRQVAAAFEHPQEFPLGRHASPHLGIVESPQGLGLGSPIAGLDGQRALGRGRKHGLEGQVENLHALQVQVETRQPGSGKQDRVVVPVAQFLEPGRDVSPQGGDPDVRAAGQDLGGAAQAGGADGGARRQAERIGVGDLEQPLAGEQEVGRSGALGHRRHRQTVGALGGQVLHGVHHQVHLLLDESELEFLGEEALALHLVEGHVLDPVARRLDDFDGDIALQAFADHRGDMVGLPQREIRATGAQAQGVPAAHGPSPLSDIGSPLPWTPLRKLSSTAEEWFQAALLSPCSGT
jgi:hypothetical protein